MDGQIEPAQLRAEWQELRKMILSLRVTELHTLLVRAGVSKVGKKNVLQEKALNLLPELTISRYNLIHELYRLRFSAVRAFNFPDAANNPGYPGANYQRNAAAAINFQPNAEPPAFALAPEVNRHPYAGAGNMNVNPIAENQNQVLAGGGPIRYHANNGLKKNNGCPYPQQNPLQRRKRDFMNVSSPKLTPSCFYDIITTIVQPKVYVQSLNERELRECAFMLKLDEVNLLALSRKSTTNPEKVEPGERNYRLQLRVAKIREADDYLPVTLRITVNGEPLQLPKSVPVNKTASSMRRPCVPIDITDEVYLHPNRSNLIAVTWNREDQNKLPCLLGVSLYIVEKISSDDLISRLSSKPTFSVNSSFNIVRKKLNGSQEDEIATTTIRASIICPLGKMVIKKPCRAITCTHLQCFDGVNFIKMNEKKPSWTCPVCDRPILFADIQVDDLWVNILSFVPDDCREVEFRKDGSWGFVKNHHQESFMLKDYTSGRQSPEVITIDSDSEDESSPNPVGNPPQLRSQVSDEADDVQCIFTVSSIEKGEMNYGASTSRGVYNDKRDLDFYWHGKNPEHLEPSYLFRRPGDVSSSDSED